MKARPYNNRRIGRASAPAIAIDGWVLNWGKKSYAGVRENAEPNEPCKQLHSATFSNQTRVSRERGRQRAKKRNLTQSFWNIAEKPFQFPIHLIVKWIFRPAYTERPRPATPAFAQCMASVFVQHKQRQEKPHWNYLKTDKRKWK